MMDIDPLARGASIGIVLLLAVGFWRTRPNGTIAWISAFFVAGVIAYLLVGHPANSTWPLAVRLGVAFVSLGAPFFWWAFALLLFDDDFQLRSIHFLWLGVIEAAGMAPFVLVFVLPGRAAPWLYEALGLGFRIISLALIAHAFWVIWRGRRTDLVETRARLRVVVTGAGVAAALILIAAVLYAPVASRSLVLKLYEAAALLILALVMGTQLLRLAQDLLPSAPKGTAPVRQLPSASDGAVTLSQALADADAKNVARLKVLMSRDEVWRETGLTVTSLATKVGMPEFRLRRLINQHLGFRNFTAFLNAYRLTAAAARLADPEQARTPVLTIALDLGWGSIGPFNRAFRACYDITPSEYRRQWIGRPRAGQNGPPFLEKPG